LRARKNVAAPEPDGEVFDFSGVRDSDDEAVTFTAPSNALTCAPTLSVQPIEPPVKEQRLAKDVHQFFSLMDLELGGVKKQKRVCSLCQYIFLCV